MTRKKKPRNRTYAPPIRTQPVTLAAEPVSSEASRLTVRQTTMMATSYSGPTPPVEVLEGYERVSPGSAKQILDQFIKQSDHRMDLENQVIASDLSRSWGGLIAGFVIALAFLGSGTYLVSTGHDWAGGTIATTSLMGLVSVFVYGTTVRKSERETKAKTMAEAKRGIKKA